MKKTLFIIVVLFAICGMTTNQNNDYVEASHYNFSYLHNKDIRKVTYGKNNSKYTPCTRTITIEFTDGKKITIGGRNDFYIFEK